MGLKTAEKAEKVIAIIRIILIIDNIFILRFILIIWIMSQVRVDLGIADHVWQEKRAAIAETIDALGDRFKPELRTGWLAYIRETYSDGPVAQAATVGEETLVLDDWVLDALGLYAHWPPVVNMQIGKFSAMNSHPNRLFLFLK